MAKLYFYYSTMNAGKSTALLQASHNYEERGMRTLLYTARIDSRDGGRIASRIGIAREARHFHPDLDLHEEIAAKGIRVLMKSNVASTQTGQLKVNRPTGMRSRMTANRTAWVMKHPNPGPSFGSRSSL